jgi:hypothetical protein
MQDALVVSPAATMTAAASGALTQSVFQTTAGANLILQAPGSNRLKGRSFTVQASGYVSGGAGTYTATVAPILYGDASLATVTTKPLFTASAGTLAYTGTAAAGLTLPWSVWAEFEGDTLSGSFYGLAQSISGATAKAQTITVAPVSAINFATEPPIKFAVGVTTAGSLGAAPKLVITEFFLRADNE